MRSDQSGVQALSLLHPDQSDIQPLPILCSDQSRGLQQEAQSKILRGKAAEVFICLPLDEGTDPNRIKRTENRYVLC